MRFRPQVLLVALAFAPAARAQSPGPPDRLRAEAIDAEDRKYLPMEGLVAFVRVHTRSVASLAFAPDGARLASSSWDGTVKLWQLGATEPKEWATLEASPSAVAFHPDGKLLATGSAGTGVYLWEVTGEKPQRKHALAGHRQRPFALAFSPNGKLLASGCFDPLLRVWKLDDGEPEAWGVLVGESGPSLGIASLAFTSDSKRLVAGCHAGKQSLRAWDAAGAYLADVELPPSRVRLVAAAPTEPLLALSGDDGKIHLWRLQGDKVQELADLPGHAVRGIGPGVKALAFSPTGRVLASAGQDRRVVLWDVANGHKRREWEMPTEARALAFAPDGRHLATGHEDGSICIFRLERAKK